MWLNNNSYISKVMHEIRGILINKIKQMSLHYKNYSNPNKWIYRSYLHRYCLFI